MCGNVGNDKAGCRGNLERLRLATDHRRKWLTADEFWQVVDRFADSSNLRRTLKGRQADAKRRQANFCDRVLRPRL